jgi:SAM-dependent methyltransferase
MPFTTSGDYKLPGRLFRGIGTAVLWLVSWIPADAAAPMEKYIHKRHDYYQVFGDNEREIPGSSSAKWRALHLPDDLTGKSIIDIGCAEGFFCLESAKRGAGMVVGVDVRLSTLICAILLASKHKVSIRYHLAAFPDFRVRQKYDYVLCLSVLHHLLSTKDIWKVISDKNYANDKQKLLLYLRALRTMTNEGGSCIVEMPYEYDEPGEKKHVDFELFNEYLLAAGFASARIIDEWEHTEREKKDRVVYIGLG